MKNIARTFRREEMFLNHWDHAKKSILLVLSFLGYSSLLSAGQQYFKLYKVLDWGRLNCEELWAEMLFVDPIIIIYYAYVYYFMVNYPVSSVMDDSFTSVDHKKLMKIFRQDVQTIAKSKDRMFPSNGTPIFLTFSRRLFLVSERLPELIYVTEGLVLFLKFVPRSLDNLLSKQFYVNKF